MSTRKPYSEMTEDELQTYHIEAQAYAEDKARDDLRAMDERGDWPPKFAVRNGVVSTQRITPFDRTKVRWGNR